MEKENIVIELLLGEQSIPVKLRMQENIDEDFKVLLEALDSLVDKYKGKTVIPKKLAYAFSDISNSFDLSEKLYSEIELEKIEDMGNELYEKIVELYES